MSRRHRRHQRLKLRSFYVWHRYMGVCAALFVVVIAITGLLLNHTEDFQFDSRYVKSDWLLDWYGIKAPDTLSSFAAHDQHITLMGEHLYLDLREIDGEYRRLVGAVYLDDLFVVAVSDSIVLLTARGDIVERLSGEDGVPAGIRDIGVDSAGLLVTRNSLEYYQADRDFLKWRRLDHSPESVGWARPAELDSRLAQSLRQHYRGEVLPMERVILDVHSGRILGAAGPWAFDVVAVLLILLALTGTFIWLRRQR